MDEQKIARIDAFLKLNGSSVESLSKSRLAQFEKVDDAIQTRLVEIEKAKETLKSIGINVSVIATDTGISRKTFYNNELLKEFVESYSTIDVEKSVSAVSASELEKIKTKNNELQKQINGFVLKDIETENLRHEIKELNREIQNIQERNESLESQYEELQAELSEAKKQLSIRNILQFNNQS